jgi:hypothetical protein
MDVHTHLSPVAGEKVTNYGCSEEHLANSAFESQEK